MSDATEPRTSSGATIMLDDIALANLYADGAIVTIADLDLRPIRLTIRAKAEARAASQERPQPNVCQCGHNRAEHESRYDAASHCTHRCIPPWSQERPSIDVEWAAVESALPEGWHIYSVHRSLPNRPEAWSVIAHADNDLHATESVHEHRGTLPEALAALAARLTPADRVGE